MQKYGSAKKGFNPSKQIAMQKEYKYPSHTHKPGTILTSKQADVARMFSPNAVERKPDFSFKSPERDLGNSAEPNQGASLKKKKIQNHSNRLSMRKVTLDKYNSYSSNMNNDIK